MRFKGQVLPREKRLEKKAEHKEKKLFRHVNTKNYKYFIDNLY